MKLLLTLIGGLAVIAAASLALAWPFMLMWNYAVTQAISSANPITYWVAACLLVFIFTFVSGSRSS